jgi:hypothetical protein
LERRPSFQTYPASASQLSGTIKRFFFWEHQSGSSFDNFILASVVGASSKVYKFKIGTDSDWVLIYTDSGTTEPCDFTVANNFLFFANGTTTRKYDGTTVTNWGISPQPTSAPTLSNVTAGNVPAAIGHYYAYAFGVSTTGYLSDISTLSAQWTTVNREVGVTGAACTDTQCDKIHVYRTEDGGSNLWELPNSPIANPGSGTWTLNDNATDDDLNFSAPGPLRGVNQPPPAIFQPTHFAGRIWGFNNDKLYYSTLEENTTSVPEECFGSSLTNMYRFGRPIKGLGVTKNALIVFMSRGVGVITGYSQATFARSTLSKTRGVKSRQNIVSQDDNVVWLDCSDTILVTDGNSIGKPDLTLPIRPDVAGIDHTQSGIEVHNDGVRNYIVLMDGGNGKLLCFDMDRKMWMPPWNLSGCTAIGSNVPFGPDLLLARSGRATRLVRTSFQDSDPTSGAATSYTASAYLALLQMNQDNSTGINDVEYVSLEGNANYSPLDLLLLIDDDPASGKYTTIFKNSEDPDQRVKGAGLLEKWYWNRTAVPPGQRVSVRIDWDALSTQFKVYTIDIAHRSVK